MAITESEAFTQFLCAQTFLSRWVIANPQIDRGLGNVNRKGRELCDAMVIFGDQILLISDKNSLMREKGNVEQNWNRWARRAILHSLRQLDGAEACGLTDFLYRRDGEIIAFARLDLAVAGTGLSSAAPVVDIRAMSAA